MCVTRGRGVVAVMVGGWRLREEGKDGKLKGIVEEGTGKFVCVWGVLLLGKRSYGYEVVAS